MVFARIGDKQIEKERGWQPAPYKPLLGFQEGGEVGVDEGSAFFDPDYIWGNGPVLGGQDSPWPYVGPNFGDIYGPANEQGLLPLPAELSSFTNLPQYEGYNDPRWLFGSSSIGPQTLPSEQAISWTQEMLTGLGLDPQLAQLVPLEIPRAGYPTTGPLQFPIEDAPRLGTGGAFTPTGAYTGRLAADYAPENRGQQLQTPVHEAVGHAIENLLTPEEWTDFREIARENPADPRQIIGYGPTYGPDPRFEDRFHALTPYFDALNTWGTPIPEPILEFLRAVTPEIVERARSAGTFQGFQEGGEVGYEPSYTDPFQDPGYEAQRQESEAARNVYDESTGGWYDPIYGNTFSPDEGVWRSPEGMVYEDGAWQWPAQYSGPIGPVPAGYYPQSNYAQQYAEPAGPAAPYLPSTGEFREPQDLLEQLQIQRQGESQYGQVAGDVAGGILGAGLQGLGSVYQGLEQLPVLFDPRVGYAGAGEGGPRFTGRMEDPVRLGEITGYPTPYREEINRALGSAGRFALEPYGLGGVGQFVGENLYPQNVLQAGLELVPGIGTVPGALSFADDIARVGLAQAARNVVAGGGREALEQVLEPSVVRLAADPQALRPLEEGLMASRGAMEVIDPSRVRVLIEGENLRPGEVELFHGTVGGLQGAPRAGLNVTPLAEDAERFAEYTARAMRAGLQEAPPPANVSRETSRAGGGLREVAPVVRAEEIARDVEQYGSSSVSGGAIGRDTDDYVSAMVTSAGPGRANVETSTGHRFTGTYEQVDRWIDENVEDTAGRARLLSGETGGVPRYDSLAEADVMRRQGLAGALTGEPGASQLQVAGGAEKPIWEMSPDEIRVERIAEENNEKYGSQQVFGPEGAKRYEAAQRTANSPNASRERQAEAERVISEMEANLTPEQEHILFGIGETGPNAEELRSIERAVNSLDFESPQALGNSLRWAVTKVEPGADPSTLTGRALEGYMQLKHGLAEAQKLGFDTGEVSAAALRGAAGRFDDPADAEFMLRQFIQPSTPPSDLDILETQLRQDLGIDAPLTAATPEELEKQTDALLTEFGWKEYNRGQTVQDYVDQLSPTETTGRGAMWGDVRSRMTAETDVGNQYQWRSLADEMRNNEYRAMRGEMSVTDSLARNQDIWRQQSLEDVQQQISNIANNIGRQLDQTEITALQERVASVERFLNNEKIDAWTRMPGGVEPGRAPGPRWSRESADYYAGAGRGGGRGMAGIRGGAVQPPNNASDVGIWDWVNLPRSMIAGMDMSYGLRQGGFMAPAHINQFRQALGDMAQAMGSGENSARIMEKLTTESEWAKRGLKLNLAPTEGGKLSDREGAVITSLVEKLPGVGPAYQVTNRGNATLLNSFRSHIVDDFIKNNGGKYSDRYLQHYINYVERATGRGSLKFGKVDLEQAQGILSNLFFSPRFTLSIPQRVGYLNPLTGGVPFGPVWREAVQDNATWLGTGATILGLAAAAGANVQLDPRKTDFGRIRVGDSHVDIWGGAQPMARAIWQGVTGQKVSETGDLTEVGPGKVGLEFLRNRMSPQGQLAAYFGGKAAGERSALGVSGEEAAQFVRPEYFRGGVFETGKTWDQVASFATPLFIQDVIAGIKHEGLTGGLLGSLSAVGIGAQTYPATAATERTLAIRDLMKDPEVQTLLPELARGLDYRQLTGDEKAKVLDTLAQRNPDLVTRYEKETEKRFGPNILSETAEKRQAIEGWKQQNLTDIMERLARGDIDPYAARKELQNVRGARNDLVQGHPESQGIPAVVGIYDTPEYKQAVKELEEAVANKRVPNDPLSDLLGARRGTPAGEALEIAGGRGAAEPGRPAPNVGEFGQLMDLLHGLPSQVKGADGKPDWDEIEFIESALMRSLQQSDPALAERIAFNRERDPVHPLEQLYFTIQDFYPEYRALLPPEGQKWTSQDFNTWRGWLESHPQEEAAMFLLGYRQEVVTREAADIVRGMAPGLDITIKQYR